MHYNYSQCSISSVPIKPTVCLYIQLLTTHINSKIVCIGNTRNTMNDGVYVELIEVE